MVNISSIESYRRTLLFQQMALSPPQIRQLGGGASQFSISSGNPLFSGGLWVGKTLQYLEISNLRLLGSALLTDMLRYVTR